MSPRSAASLGLVILLLCAASPAVLAQTPDEPQEHMGMSTAPTLVLRAFGSVDWSATQLGDTPNSFALGQFDLFMTSALSERISVLAEIVLEGGTSTRVVTDLERLQLTFRFNDYLQLSAGRYHTGIGYYNAAFHHGAFFETVIGRPRIYHFEDEGGVLPVHEVGVSVRGVVPKTSSGLHYLAEIGNGRTYSTTADAEEEGLDANAAKAVNLGVSYRPERWRGLDIGVSYYADTVPREPLPSIQQGIAAAYLVYRTPSVEIMSEWLRLSHRMQDGATYINDAGYVQASRAWGRLRPYYRYDRQVIDPRTPLIGDAGSYTANIVGLRIDPAEWVGLKIQYERADEAGQRGVDSIRTALVFVF